MADPNYDRFNRTSQQAYQSTTHQLNQAQLTYLQTHKPELYRAYQNHKTLHGWESSTYKGHDTAREVQKEWARRVAAHGEKTIHDKHADKDVAMRAICAGHKPEAVAKALEKHSPHVGSLPEKQRAEHARISTNTAQFDLYHHPKAQKKFMEVQAAKAQHPRLKNEQRLEKLTLATPVPNRQQEKDRSR